MVFEQDSLVSDLKLVTIYKVWIITFKLPTPILTSSFHHACVLRWCSIALGYTVHSPIAKSITLPTYIRIHPLNRLYKILLCTLTISCQNWMMSTDWLNSIINWNNAQGPRPLVDLFCKAHALLGGYVQVWWHSNCDDQFQTSTTNTTHCVLFWVHPHFL